MRNVILFLILILSARIPAQTRGPGPRYVLLQPAGITKDSIFTRVKNDLRFIQLKARDTVADIGSYDGYYPCMYSLFSDSVTFYLNDITGEAFTGLDSMKVICSGKRGKGITNTFQVTIGNDSCTNLPDHFFGKVVLRDALHHFANPDKMLADVKRIMKPGAELILFETIKDNGGSNPHLCKGAMTKDELIKLMRLNKFKLKRELALPGNNYWFEFSIKK